MGIINIPTRRAIRPANRTHTSMVMSPSFTCIHMSQISTISTIIDPLVSLLLVVVVALGSWGLLHNFSDRKATKWCDASVREV